MIPEWFFNPRRVRLSNIHLRNLLQTKVHSLLTYEAEIRIMARGSTIPSTGSRSETSVLTCNAARCKIGKLQFEQSATWKTWIFAA